MTKTNGWIAVDFDGTLAHYDKNQYPKLGNALPTMLNRVRRWVKEGQEVRIFTARATQHDKNMIQDWLEHYGLPRLEVTNQKDFDMIALYDDRAYRVESNTGFVCDDNYEYERGYADGREDGYAQGHQDGVRSGTEYPHTS